jgi:precorrin-3B synthase
MRMSDTGPAGRPTAPACESAKLSTRELALAIAEAARRFLDGSLTIHISGCAKGCAHPGAAALTFIGPNRLVVQGRADDIPHGTTSITNFIVGVSRLSAKRQTHGASPSSPCVAAWAGSAITAAAVNGLARAGL